MAPYQFIDRPSPFNSRGGKTLPIFAITPAHIETGTIDPVALDWARKAGFKADVGSLLLVPTDDGHLGGALFGLGKTPSPAAGQSPKLSPRKCGFPANFRRIRSVANAGEPGQ